MISHNSGTWKFQDLEAEREGREGKSKKEEEGVKKQKERGREEGISYLFYKGTKPT
jgi:hypothetical protein